MLRPIAILLPLALAGCVTARMAGPPPAACVPRWSEEFAERLATEADALPADAAAREALAELAGLRNSLPRC